MKLSKRNVQNTQAEAERRQAKPPLISKYARKVRAQYQPQGEDK